MTDEERLALEAQPRNRNLSRAAAPDAPEALEPEIEIPSDIVKFEPDAVSADAEEHLPREPHSMKPRQRRAAMLFVMGKSLTEISKLTGYTIAWLSLLLRTRAMRIECDRLHNAVFEEDAIAELKRLNREALESIREVMASGTTKERVETAKWLIEKNTGKPRQEVAHESSSLLAFMELARRMEQAGERFEPQRLERTAIDVTPGPKTSVPGMRSDSAPESGNPEETSNYRTWIDANLG